MRQMNLTALTFNPRNTSPQQTARLDVLWFVTDALLTLNEDWRGLRCGADCG